MYPQAMLADFVRALRYIPITSACYVGHELPVWVDLSSKLEAVGMAYIQGLRSFTMAVYSMYISMPGEAAVEVRSESFS